MINTTNPFQKFQTFQSIIKRGGRQKYRKVIATITSLRKVSNNCLLKKERKENQTTN